MLIGLDVSGGTNATYTGFDIFVNIYGDGVEPAEWEDVNQSFNQGQYGYNTFRYEPSAGAQQFIRTITLTDDAFDEYDETFRVEITAVADGLDSAIVAEKLVTIIDNDEAPVLLLRPTSPSPNFSIHRGVSLGESQSPWSFQLKLSEQSEKELSIDVFTFDGTAIGGDTGQFGPDAHKVDYEAISTNIIRPRGPDQGTIIDTVDVLINDDIWHELTESFSISATGNEVRTLEPPLTVRIDHNDNPTATFEDPDLPAASGTHGRDSDKFDFEITEGGVAGFKVSISNPSTIPLEVTARGSGWEPESSYWGAPEGYGAGAIPGFDFEAEEQTWTILPGQVGPISGGIEVIDDDEWWWAAGMRVDAWVDWSTGEFSRSFLIVDDQPFPTLSTNVPADVMEGGTFTAQHQFSHGFERDWSLLYRTYLEPDPKQTLYLNTDGEVDTYDWGVGWESDGTTILGPRRSIGIHVPAKSTALAADISPLIGGREQFRDNDRWDPDRTLHYVVDDRAWVAEGRGGGRARDPIGTGGDTGAHTVANHYWLEAPDLGDIHDRSTIAVVEDDPFPTFSVERANSRIEVSLSAPVNVPVTFEISGDSSIPSYGPENFEIAGSEYFYISLPGWHSVWDAATSRYLGDGGFVTFGPGETTRSFSVSPGSDSAGFEFPAADINIHVKPLNLPTEQFTGSYLRRNNSNPRWYDLQPEKVYGPFQWERATVNLTGTESVTINVPAGPLLPVVDLDESVLHESDENAIGTVRLSYPFHEDVHVTLQSRSDEYFPGNEATPGVDFTAVDLSVLIPAGDTSATFPVEIIDDTEHEGEEHIWFFPSASNVRSAGIGRKLTILDHAISITADIPVTYEGLSTWDFRIEIDQPSSLPISVQIITEDGTATAGEDYVAVNETIVIPAGTTVVDRSVSILDNSIFEKDEHFTIRILSAENGDVVAPEAVVTIRDLGLVNAQLTVDESVGDAVYRLELTEPAPFPMSVSVSNLATIGTALSPDDYAAFNQSVEFQKGQQAAEIHFPIVDDTEFEDSERFYVTTHSSLADSANGEGIVTIEDRSVSIEGTTVAESEGNAVVTVRLDKPAISPVSFTLTTGDGSATAPADYEAVTFTGTVAVGSLSANVLVPIIDDDELEDIESFRVELSAISNADPVKTSADIFITDNDNFSNEPRISAGDMAVPESAGWINYPVLVANADDEPITVSLRTTSGTATAGDDFLNWSGTLTIPANTATGTVPLFIRNDDVSEPTERFNVIITGVSRGSVDDGSGSVLIRDDESDSGQGPIVHIVDHWVHEKHGAPNGLQFNIDNPNDQPIDIVISTADGTAVAPADYQSLTNRSIRIPANVSTYYWHGLRVTDDGPNESSEWFSASISVTGANGSTGDDEARITILDLEDSLPGVIVHDATVSESAGTAPVQITVSQANENPIPLTVTLTPNTATPDDFTQLTTSITVPGNVSSFWFDAAAIIDDALPEPAEDFGITIALSGSVDAEVLREHGTITIERSDNAVDPSDSAKVAVKDVTVSEADGIAVITVEVVESGAPGSAKLVFEDGTAHRDIDYRPSGVHVLSFSGGLGETVTVSVPIIDDVRPESTESFLALLFEPTGTLVISDPTGVVTITDDDTMPEIILHEQTADESTGIVNYRIEFSSPLPEAIDFDVSTNSTAGTADPALDYIGETTSIHLEEGTLSFTVPISIIDDPTYEDSEYLNVEILNSPHYAGSIGRLTITDIGLSLTDAAASEAEGKVTALVSLTSPSESSLQIQLATQDDTAVNPDDYTAVSTTFTIPQGVTSYEFSVPLIDDTEVEDTETLRLIVTDAGATDLVDGEGLLSILDDDQPRVPQIALGELTISEGAGTGGIPVSVIDANESSIILTLAATDETATSGEDYLPPATQITIPPLTAAFEIPFQLIDDLLTEEPERFHISVTGSVNAKVVDGNASVLIQDNESSDSGVPKLSIGNVRVDEAIGIASLTAKIDRTHDEDVVFTLTTVEGTAAAGSDYTHAVEEVTIPAGQLSVDWQVALTNDTIFESTETLNVVISQVSSAEVSDGVATVEIYDVGINISDITVAESDGSVSIVLSLTEESGSEVVASLSTADGSAVSGSDYTPFSGQVTFAAGVVEKTVAVGLLDDSLPEDAEYFFLNALSVTNADPVGDALIDIADDDGPMDGSIPKLSIVDAVTVENSGSVFVTISGDDLNGQAVSVEVTSQDATAQEGSDFVAVSTTVEIPAGESFTTVEVKIIDDAIPEEREELRLILSSPSVGRIVDATAVVSIVDDDSTPLPILSVTDLTVDESAGDAFVIVNLDRAAETDVSFEYQTIAASAISGEDYQATTGTVTIPSGETSATVPVQILDDLSYEQREHFLLEVSNAVSATVADNIGRVQITDVGIYLDDAVFDEDVGVVSYTGGLTAPFSQGHFFQIDSWDLTATETEDYELLTTGSVSDDRMSFAFDIEILDDLDIENPESFALYFSSVTGLDPISGAVITINDNDGNGGPRVSIPDQLVLESDGTVSLTVEVTDPNETDIVINLNTAELTEDDAATSGIDFQPIVNELLTIPANSDSATFQFTVNDDFDIEPHESLIVTASLVSGNLASVVDNTATITILDDDGTDSAPEVSIADVTFSEAAGTVDVTIDVQNPNSSPVSLLVNTANSASAAPASAGVDYASLSDLPVLVPANTTSASFSLTIHEDAVIENTEDLLVQLTLVSSDNAILVDDEASIFIEDNDQPAGPSVSIDDVSVSESAGTFDVTINVANPNSTPIELRLSTSDVISGDAATPNVDYQQITDQPIVIPADADSHTFQVTINEDLQPEPREAFLLQLALISAGNATLDDGEATVTIVDNDGAPVLWISDATFNEQDGVVTYTIDIENPSFLPGTVRVRSVDDTATAPNDFIQIDETIFVPGGAESVSFSLTIEEDSLYEGVEQFLITLAEPSGVELGNSAAIVTIIDNDNAPAVSLTDATLVESNETLSYVIEVDQVVTTPVYLTVSTELGDSTATRTQDYVAQTTDIVIPAGESSFVLPVEILDDFLVEGEEFLTMTIISVLNADVARQTGRITIIDNDSVNHAPYFVTNPDLEHSVAGLPSAPSGDVSPQQIVVELDDNESWTGPVTATVQDIRPGFNVPQGPENLLSVYAENDLERLAEVLLGDGETGITINTAESQLRSYYQVPPTIGSTGNLSLIDHLDSVVVPIDVTWPSRPGIAMFVDFALIDSQGEEAWGRSFSDTESGVPDSFILDAFDIGLSPDSYYIATLTASDAFESVTKATYSFLITVGNPAEPPPEVPAPTADVPHGTAGVFVNNAGTFGMEEYGIVLSTGSVNDYGTAERDLDDIDTYWDRGNDDPDEVERALLNNVIGASNQSTVDEWFDASLFRVNFDVDADVERIYFDVVLGSEEFAEYTTQYRIDHGTTAREDGSTAPAFLDAFGMFINGSEVSDNIAYAAADTDLIEDFHELLPGYDPADTSYSTWPVAANIDHPEMRYDTGETYLERDPNNPGRPDERLTGTRLNGILAPAREPVLRFFADVVPGSTNNTLTFVIGDNIDPWVDTTVYISRLSGWSPYDRPIDLVASDPAAPFDNLSGIQLGAPKEQVTFDVELHGTGTAHAFDVQVSDVETGRLLGSIPVAINGGYIYPSLAVDPDGDSITYSLTEKPGTASIDAGTGRIEWIPTLEDIESVRTSAEQTTFEFDFTLVATDPAGASDTQSFTVTVTVPQNAPPTVDPINNQTTVVGTDLLVDVVASDLDGDSLNYYLSEGPGGAYIDSHTGQFTWESTYSQVGQAHPVTITVFDGRGGSAQVEFTVEATPATDNSPPVFGGQPSGPHIILPELPAIGEVTPEKITTDIRPGETLQVTANVGIFDQNYNDYIPPVVDNALVVYDENDDQSLLFSLLARGDTGINISSTNVSVNRQVHTGPSLQQISDITTSVGATLQIPYQLVLGDAPVQYTVVDSASQSLGLRADALGQQIIWENIPANYNDRHFVVTLFVADDHLSWVTSTFVITVGSPSTDKPVTEDSRLGPIDWTSTGVFVNDTSIYGLGSHGIVLSTGNARDYVSAENVHGGHTTAFNEPATPEQEFYLDQITGDATTDNQHFDVSELIVNFDMLPPSGGVTHDTLYFDIVFGSEEYDEYVNAFIDGFGIFFNESGQEPVNYAMTDFGEVDELPVNVSHPSFARVTGTELNGVLKHDQQEVLRFAIPVTPGSVDNTLRIIVGDTRDAIFDTTVYIANLTANPDSAVTIRPELSDSDSGVSMAAVPSLVETEYGEHAEFQIELQSDGRASNAYVNFLDDATGNLIGALPLTLNNGFHFYATADDPDLDRVHHTLVSTNAPGDVSVNTDSGLISWQPDVAGLDDLPKDSANLPVASFTIRADDLKGGVAEETFSVSVDFAAANNQSPVIHNTPPLQAEATAEYQFQVLASDPEGDALRYYISEFPLGMTIDELTGDLRWRPNVSFAETTQWVTLHVMDRISAPTTLRFSIDVLPPSFGINQPPEITSDPPTSAFADALMQYDVTAIDPDGADGSLRYELLFGPSGATIVPGTNQVAWKPATDQIGEQFEFGILVTDAYGATDSQTFAVEVFSANDAPVIQGISNLTSTTGFQWNGLTEASDPNGDRLSYSLTAGDGFSINAESGLVTSIARTAGNYQFTVQVSDSHGATTSQTFQLTVADNHAPVFESSPVLEVVAGEIYRYNIVASDPDGDQIDLAWNEDASAASGPVSHQPTFTAGLLQWTTEASDLGTSYDMELLATDPMGVMAVQRFSIVVVSELSGGDGTEAPTFTSSPAGPLTSTTPWSYTPTATDPDTDDSTLSFDLVTGPPTASFDVATQTVLWTPSAGDAGTDVEMTVSVSDGVNIVEQTFVLPVDRNLAPEFLSTPEPTALIGSEYRYEILAADPNGDSITFTLDEAAKSAGVSIDGTTLTWTPNSLSPLDILLTASDGQLTAEQQFTVTVQDTNTPPEFISEPYLYTQSGVDWWYFPSVYDKEGDLVYFSVESDSVSLIPHPDNPDGPVYVLYMDTPEYPVEDLPLTVPVTFIVTDVKGASDRQVFEITVLPPDEGRTDPPVVTSTPIGPAWVGEEWTYQIEATATEAIVYSFISGPTETTGMTVSADGLVSWTPTVTGNYWVQIWVGAGNNGTSHGFLLPVETKNAPPKIYSVPYDPVYVGAEWQYQVVVDDPDGDLITLELETDLAGVSIDEHHLVTFTPGIGAVGLQTIKITASDGNGGEWIEEIDLEVRMPDDAEQFDSGQPVILSVPANAAILGEPWSYQVVAMDPNPEENPDGTLIETEFRYYVDAANTAAGLRVDHHTGLVTFDPRESQVGRQFTGAVLVEERINGVPGAQTSFRFPLRVIAHNRGPVITSTPKNQAYVSDNSLWSYPLTVEDPDGDELIYILDEASIAAGFQIVDDTDRPGEDQKKIIWQPDNSFAVSDNDRVQGHSVHLTIHDRDYERAYEPIEQTGEFSVIGIARQAFTVTIADNDLPAAIGAPAIVSLPSITAKLNEPWEYQLEVGPGNNDFVPEVTYHLISGPQATDAGVTQNMTVDEQTGLVTWVASSVGHHVVGVEIRSSSGSVLDQQRFLLSAVEPEGANEAPVFVTPSLPAGFRNVPYSFAIDVFDVNNHNLTWQLENGPDGLLIDADTGVLSWANPDWSPLDGSDRTYEFDIVVRETDSFDELEARKTYKLTFAENAPPEVTSDDFLRLDWRDAPFTHVLIGVDPNGDTLAFSVVESALPAGMTFDGTDTLSWAPTESSLGRHSVAVTLTDANGASVTQTLRLHVVDSQVNHAPQILNQVRTTVPSGFEFTHYVIAQDLEEDALTFSIAPLNESTPIPEGIEIDADSGILTWTPAADQIGTQQFRIVVTESLETGDIRTPQVSEQIVAVTVTAELQNIAPMITSTPKRSATWGYEYSFMPSVVGDIDGPPITDGDNDPVFWTLLDAPSGMTVDPLTGVVTWTPDSDDATGFYDISLQAADPYGGTDVLNWAIRVREQNLAPLLTVPSIVNVPMNTPGFVWKATAYDIDENDLTFARTDAGGDGLTIAPDGTLTWNPQSPTAAIATVQVSDGRGGVDSRAVTFLPYDPSFNSPPTAVGVGTTVLVVPIDDTATMEFSVDDDEPFATESEDLQLTLTTSFNGLTLDHVTGSPGAAHLMWSAPDVAEGHYLVEFTITDDHFSPMTSHFVQVVHVRSNALPDLTDLDNVTVVAGQTHEAQAIAKDADRDLLTWDIDVRDTTGQSLAQTWYDIDRNGEFTLATPTDLLHGDYTVDVSVKDVASTSVTRSFTLTVNNDVDAPEVSVSLSKDPASLNEPFTVSIAATDNVGVVSLLASYQKVGTTDLIPLSLDQFGKAELTLAAVGAYEIFVTATDAAGNQSPAAAAHSFDVVDRPPVIELLTPAAGETIKEPTSLVATIQDAESLSADVTWSVTLQHSEGGRTHVLNQSTGEVTEASIGYIDTTILDNGQYTLVVAATDGDGNTSTVSRVIQIDGRLKLGNFNLSFTDLEINTPGIPITVSRTYDTLMADRSLDFGYGWQLDLGRPELDVTYPSNRKTDFEGDYIPFRDGTRISVRLPDGNTEWFTFKTSLKIGNGYGIPWGERAYVPYFVPDSTARTQLYLAEEIILTKAGDEYLYHQRAFNPTVPLSKVDFRLVLYNESVIGIDPVSGDSYVEDRNENRVTIRDSGSVTTMTHSDGKQVRIYRDPQNFKRIHTVEDPAGNVITYHYNADGELADVVDRVENFKLAQDPAYQPASVTLEYWDHAAYPHYLNRIVDQVGREITEAVYDPDQDGRVIQLKDASQATIDFAHEVGEKSQTSEDSYGRETQAFRDADGNVIRSQQVIRNTADDSISHYEDVVIRDYDDKGNVVYEQTVVGEIDGAGDDQKDLIQEFGYTSYGAISHSQDIRGNQTSYGYDKHGSLISTTDPLGNLVRNEYDDNGNLTETTDGLRSTKVTYSAGGQVAQVFDLDNPDVALVTNKYFESGPHRGMLESSTDLNGNTTTFGYDANGNQNLISRTVGAGTLDEVRIEDHTVYDPNGRIVHSSRMEYATDENGDEYLRNSNASTTNYNLLGQVNFTVDDNGLRSESVYDERGLVIQTRNEIRGDEYDPVAQAYVEVSKWLITRTVYDAFGRATVVTDSYVEGTTEPISGRYTVYNEKGLATQSYSLNDVQVRILDSTSTEYTSDATFSESLVLHTTWNGLYDASTNASGATVLSTSTTHYDEQERVAWTQDNYGRRTENDYNQFGDVVETRRQSQDYNPTTDTYTDVWIVTRTVYDDHGRTVASTDSFLMSQDLSTVLTDNVQGGRTTYDDRGRVETTRRVNDLDIWIDPVTGDSRIKSVGDEISVNTTIYNDKGQTAASVRTVFGVDGQPDEVTQTDYEYDELGRQTATIGAAVPVAGMELTPPANAEAVRLRSETIHNDLGQVEKERTNIHQYVITGSTDPVIDATQVQETTFEYDSEGRVTKTILNDGTFTTTKYDDEGRVESETNQLGLTRTFSYDAQGRQTSVTLPGVPDPLNADTVTNPVYQYRYDAYGNLIEITDPLGRDTVFTFTEDNEQETRTLPLGLGADGMLGTADDGSVASDHFEERFEYDERGRQKLHFSFEGVVTEYIYDDDPTLATSVPDTGRLFQKRYFRNEADFIAGSVSETITMTFDAFGRETTTVWDRLPATPGVVVDIWTNTYDDLGRLASVSSPTGEVLYEYDSQGRQIRVATRPNGFIPADADDVSTDIRYTYDLLGRLASVQTWERNDIAVDADPTAAGQQPETESYIYDVLGNLDRVLNPDGTVTD
ncbi:MAG: putative Ig domain-containing protein [Planctomycetaceae bacterium]|nr:putative Ig domain-containing protein [Planctomycetaceae bacterium]